MLSRGYIPNGWNQSLSKKPQKINSVKTTKLKVIKIATPLVKALVLILKCLCLYRSHQSLTTRANPCKNP